MKYTRNPQLKTGGEAKRVPSAKTAQQRPLGNIHVGSVCHFGLSHPFLSRQVWDVRAGRPPTPDPMLVSQSKIPDSKELSGRQIIELEVHGFNLTKIWREKDELTPT